MSFVIKSLKTIREHWKKSVFFSLVIGYSTNHFKEKFDINQLMRVYCEEAQKYGDEKINVIQPPRMVTVILNPNANKSKAKAQFEKYCAPILHLAGLSVDVIFTESEGHAKTILDKVGQTDAIIIGGGDGTVSEVVTGLLRRYDNDASRNSHPIGVLPLGRSNTLAKSLFPGGEKLSQIRSLADAAMAVVKQNTRTIDLMKVEVQNDSNVKPIYAVGKLEWGVFRDAEAVKDKYWYFGRLRNYVTYLFNGSELNSPCEAKIAYSLPCPGCKNCAQLSTVQNRRWFGLFGGRANLNTKAVVTTENPQCSQMFEKTISTTSFCLETTNIIQTLGIEIPQLMIHVGPDKINYIEFVKQGWTKDKRVVENLSVRQIQIKPSETSLEGNELSIDNENFELRPITVTLLPKAIKVFTLS